MAVDKTTLNRISARRDRIRANVQAEYRDAERSLLQLTAELKGQSPAVLLPAAQRLATASTGLVAQLTSLQLADEVLILLEDE